jgi:hypothetical protein
MDLMIVCEYLFKVFNSRGSDDYLLAWTIQVDCMAAEGWTVLECYRDPGQPGFWTTVLWRSAERFC